MNAGVVEGPRILAFGMVSMTAGHGDLFTPPAITNRRPTADGPDQSRALVRHWARAGADGIKIATSGGVLSVGDRASWRNHTATELEAIVDEAHALSMAVAAHAHTPEGVAAAPAAGVDSLEHATLITPQLAETAAAAEVTIAPTLLINDRIARGGAGVTEDQQHKAAALVSRRDDALRAAERAGVDIVLGTDANGHHVAFGDEFEELRAMASLFAWSAERALQAGTSRAARAIGRAGSLGMIEADAAADFVVMRGQPWQRVEHLDARRIVAVVSRGRVVAGALPTA